MRHFALGKQINTNWRCIHTCLVWFDWIEIKFVSPFGADILGSWEYSNRTQVWTKQLYRDPAEEVVSVSFQTNSGTVEWMNQWMDDLKNSSGFVYSFGLLANRAVWKRTAFDFFLNHINIVFGPDQSKWTRGLFLVWILCLLCILFYPYQSFL